MDRKRDEGVPVHAERRPADPDPIGPAGFGAYGRNRSVDRVDCVGAPARWIPYRSIGPIRVALGDPFLAGAAPAWQRQGSSRWVVWYGASDPVGSRECRPFGQEAIVPTATFSLRGRRMGRLRSALHIAERNGIDVVEGRWRSLPDHLRRQVCEMQRAWRVRHPIAYGFTNSTFTDATADDRPWSLGLRGGRVVAFVTWLPSADERGWVLDLMRRRPGAGHGAMDLLVTRGLERARSEGLDWVSLGIGIEGTGLRRFKDKFRPEWKDRYILLPGGSMRRAIGMAAVAAAHLAPAQRRRGRPRPRRDSVGPLRRSSSSCLAGARLALATALLVLLCVLSVPQLEQASRDRADQVADRIQSTPAARRAVSAWEHRPHPSLGHLTLPGPRLRLD